MSEDINSMIYDRNHHIIINGMSDNIYYYFDYEQRSYQVNMDFQHFHSFHEIHILMSPKASHMIEGIPYTIHTNDFVLLKPSLLHKTFYPQGPPSKRIIINFLFPQEYMKSHPALSVLLTPFETPLPIFRFDSEKLASLNQVLNIILTISKQPLPKEVQTMMIHNYFLEFLYKLWELKDHNLYVPEKFDNEISEKIYKITSYIHNHYQENLSLNAIARQFFISVHYLSHQFPKVTGYTLTEYIQMTRIRNAQYALINTSDKITTISELCGFNSFSQFNRVFRKFCRISPSDFRKNPITSLYPPQNVSE